MRKTVHELSKLKAEVAEISRILSAESDDDDDDDDEVSGRKNSSHLGQRVKELRVRLQRFRHTQEDKFSTLKKREDQLDAWLIVEVGQHQHQQPDATSATQIQTGIESGRPKPPTRQMNIIGDEAEAEAAGGGASSPVVATAAAAADDASPPRRMSSSSSDNRRRRRRPERKETTATRWSNEDWRIFMREVMRRKEVEGIDQFAERVWRQTSGRVSSAEEVKSALRRWEKRQRERSETRERVRSWRMNKSSAAAAGETRLEEGETPKKQQYRDGKADPRLGEWREMRRIKAELERSDRLAREIGSKLLLREEFRNARGKYRKKTRKKEAEEEEQKGERRHFGALLRQIDEQCRSMSLAVTKKHFDQMNNELMMQLKKNSQCAKTLLTPVKCDNINSCNKFLSSESTFNRQTKSSEAKLIKSRSHKDEAQSKKSSFLNPELVSSRRAIPDWRLGLQQQHLFD